MSPEKQRIAIAEACGFKPNNYGLWFKNNRAYGLVEIPEDNECVGIGGGYQPAIPDYPNDLNAMHEAEKTLPDEKLWLMTHALASVVPAGVPIAHASAAQRAQAFLMVIEKWEEDKPATVRGDKDDLPPQIYRRCL